MKTVLRFVKTTLIGGLLVLLPVWLLALLLLKAINSALVVLKPIAELLPQHVIHAEWAAFGLLLLICFATGLLVRPRPVRRLGHWLEGEVFNRVPGYSLVRRITRRLAGTADEQSFQPALVAFDDTTVPAFIVEKHADGQVTVFIPSSPTPLVGAIHIVAGARVHPVDVPLHKAVGCITEWGAGTGQWLAAMRPKPAND